MTELLQIDSLVSQQFSDWDGERCGPDCCCPACTAKKSYHGVKQECRDEQRHPAFSNADSPAIKDFLRAKFTRFF